MNQDPIGLLGGMNSYAYPHAPTGWVDPLGLVRWRDLASSAVGILGNGAGIIVGGALLAAPEPTMLTKPVGAAVLAKSTYGFGTSWYNFTRAWSDDNSYDIQENYTTLTRASTAALSCSGDICQSAADIADLSLDLASGRLPVNSRILPFGIEAMKPPRVPVSSMFNRKQNVALDSLQGTAVIQSLTGTYGDLNEN